MRILILARHYPPAVSGGAKRPFLLAQALRKAGADVRVVAPSLPEGEPGWSVSHANRDPATATGQPRASLRGLARDMLLWPDPDIRWCLRAARTAVASGETFDWVISTSPPESIHVAGAYAAKRLGARWAADFRDLWLMNPHRSERLRWHRRLGERLQARRLLPRADLVTAVDPVVAQEAASLGARTVELLPHFTFNDAPAPASLSADRLNVVHAGSIALSDPEADIARLLAPFDDARRTNPALMLHFVGRLTDRETAAIAASASADHIRTHGPRPLEEALSFMAAADALIFVASAKMHVPPSKIADYLIFDAPVIACGDGPWRKNPRVPTGDPAEAMAGLKRGDKHNIALAPRKASEAAASLLQMMRDVERTAG